jgi:predicted cupin superfamily sugar epimerase
MHPRAAELIRALGLEAHPEGGHFRRVHASATQLVANGRARPASTAIRYLLARGETSRWHRVDADETWHWQEGDPLELLEFAPASDRLRATTLGDSAQGLQPMRVVPAGVWQAARPLGDYALVACTVSPGFVWEGFELLDAGSDIAARLRALAAPLM